eukprot:IDg3324t1
MTKEAPAQVGSSVTTGALTLDTDTLDRFLFEISTAVLQRIEKPRKSQFQALVATPEDEIQDLVKEDSGRSSSPMQLDFTECPEQDAEVRSWEQKLAMEAIYAKQSDLEIILSKGFGKTAVGIRPVIYKSGVPVWISLKVLPVAPKEAGRNRFLEMMLMLHRSGNLNRIVLDEAHIPLFSWKYRDCMTEIKGIDSIGLKCQRVLLTATAPPEMLKQIAKSIGVNYGELEVI